MGWGFLNIEPRDARHAFQAYYYSFVQRLLQMFAFSIGILSVHFGEYSYVQFVHIINAVQCRMYSTRLLRPTPSRVDHSECIYIKKSCKQNFNRVTVYLSDFYPICCTNVRNLSTIIKQY